MNKTLLQGIDSQYIMHDDDDYIVLQLFIIT